jgi:hypothetical protein
MMRAGDAIARTLVFLSASCLAIPGTSAQMIAFRDLTTGWRVPSERVAGPNNQNCPKINSSVSDGEQSDSAKSSKPQGERLELQVVEISPAQLKIGEEFSATVRVKNTGSNDVLVPGTADGAQLSGSAGNDTEEKYEVADVSFRLATGKDHRTPIFLDSTGALFADPDNKQTYVSLAPGNWLDIKLKGAVECGTANCLGVLQPDSDAVLTAWWYQRVLTHSVKGCDEVHGAFTIRQLDSTPFRVVVRKSLKKLDATPQI